MAISNKHLEHIKWKSIALQDSDLGAILILICEDGNQAFDLLELLTTQPFSLYIEKPDLNTSRLVIRFTDLFYEMSNRLTNPEAINFINAHAIKYLTTANKQGNEIVIINEEPFVIKESNYINPN